MPEAPAVAGSYVGFPRIAVDRENELIPLIPRDRPLYRQAFGCRSAITGRVLKIVENLSFLTGSVSVRHRTQIKEYIEKRRKK